MRIKLSKEKTSRLKKVTGLIAVQLSFLCLGLGVAHAGSDNGGMSSGGGNAVVCKAIINGQRTQTVQFFDLWEYQDLPINNFKNYKKTLPKAETLAEAAEIIAQRISYDKLDPSYTSLLDGKKDASGRMKFSRQQIREIFFRLVMVAESQDEPQVMQMTDSSEVRTVPDSDHINVPNGNCRLVQLANYQMYSAVSSLSSQVTLLVNKNIFNLMTPIHKAAFLLHEAMYLYLRKFGQRESGIVRRTVARILFDESAISPVVDSSALTEKNLFCMSSTYWSSIVPYVSLGSSYRFDTMDFRNSGGKGFVFWVTQNNRMLFEIIKGVPVLTRTEVDIANSHAVLTGETSIERGATPPFVTWTMPNTFGDAKLSLNFLMQIVSEYFHDVRMKPVGSGIPHLSNPLILSELRTSKTQIYRTLRFDGSTSAEEIRCLEVSKTRNKSLLQGRFESLDYIWK